MTRWSRLQSNGSSNGRIAVTLAPRLQAAWLLLCITASQLGLAQEPGKHGLDYTYAPGSPTYWRNTHSTRPGDFVFRRDPNVWVYTPEVAQRVGMPLEWASDELKGVAAAAFRMERDGAEEDCGWGGNPKACKPLVRCVLELYFDRQAHPLPWAPDRMVADFYWQDVSTAYHFLPANGFEPASNGDLSRGNKNSKNFPNLGARQPFADPQTGEELMFEPGPDNPSGVRLGGNRITAYDKEIHGRYTFVRVQKFCMDIPNLNPKGVTLQLQTRDGSKVFNQIFFPAKWTQRLIASGKADKQQDNDFYKGIWNNLNSGVKK